MTSVAIIESEPAQAGHDYPECLSRNLNWLLAQAHHALGAELAAEFAALGITPRGHTVLTAATTGSHTQRRLAEIVGLDKTTMVATLDDLEAAGLAERVPSPTDRRAHVVRVTEAGLRRIAEANQLSARVQADVLSSLGEEGGAEFLQALASLVTRRLDEPPACRSMRRREPRPRAV